MPRAAATHGFMVFYDYEGPDGTEREIVAVTRTEAEARAIQPKVVTIWGELRPTQVERVEMRGRPFKRYEGGA